MGTTTGTILISYDINKSHTQVKGEMEKLGYTDSFKYNPNPKVNYLPNTTLWHQKKSSDQAIIDLKAVCKSLGVILEKAVAVNASEFVGI